MSVTPLKKELSRDGLPDELVKQLSKRNQTPEVSNRVIKIIKDLAKQGTVDNILIS